MMEQRLLFYSNITSIVSNLSRNKMFEMIRENSSKHVYPDLVYSGLFIFLFTSIVASLRLIAHPIDRAVDTKEPRRCPTLL